jgi:hypothetical protein
MKYTSRVDGTEILVPINPKLRNAIMISGGLDSAVLLAILVSNGVTPTTYTIDKSDGSYYNTIKLIDWMNTKWGWAISHPMKVGNTQLHHSEQGKSAVIEILDNNWCDLLYNAINQNPPELEDLPGAPNRKINNPSKKLAIPFFHLQKTHIIDLMFQLNLQELSDHTHSCTEQTEGRCGVCWQCTERKFAFGKLGFLDTGKF